MTLFQNFKDCSLQIITEIKRYLEFIERMDTLPEALSLESRFMQNLNFYYQNPEDLSTEDPHHLGFKIGSKSNLNLILRKISCSDKNFFEETANSSKFKALMTELTIEKSL